MSHNSYLGNNVGGGVVREKKCIVVEGGWREGGGQIVLSLLRRVFFPLCMQIKTLALCGTI